MTGPIASSWEYNLKGFPSERGESTPRASPFLGNEDIELLGRSISGSWWSQHRGWLEGQEEAFSWSQAAGLRCWPILDACHLNPSRWTRRNTKTGALLWSILGLKFTLSSMFLRQRSDHDASHSLRGRTNVSERITFVSESALRQTSDQAQWDPENRWGRPRSSVVCRRAARLRSSSWCNLFWARLQTTRWWKGRLWNRISQSLLVLSILSWVTHLFTFQLYTEEGGTSPPIDAYAVRWTINCPRSRRYQLEVTSGIRSTWRNERPWG